LAFGINPKRLFQNGVADSGHISWVWSAIGAMLLVFAPSIASVAFPAPTPLAIVASNRTEAGILVDDEVAATSAPIALVIASVAQPKAGMLV
jgi:hypothetical protein